ncbi:MAG: CvpA family protein [Taibaiella sp.]|jgi:membrane protein required for colicin V production
MIIDAIFLICLLIFLIRGYSKGVVVALFSVVAIILGVLGALKLSGTLASLLFEGGEKGGRWVPFVSYIIVFFLIVWLVRLGSKLIQRSFEAVALGWVNRMAGALLYAFLISFVFSSILWLFNQMGVIKPETKSASYVYEMIEPLAPKVFSLISTVLPFAKHIFEDLSGFFDHVNQKLRDVGTH